MTSSSSLLNEADGVIINAGALTHYGLSMRDALSDARLPIIEVHISNIHARDEYRRHSVVADMAIGQIAGFGWRGYLYALDFLVAHIGEQESESEHIPEGRASPIRNGGDGS